jgi:hypothetical protein
VAAGGKVRGVSASEYNTRLSAAAKADRASTVDCIGQAQVADVGRRL